MTPSVQDSARYRAFVSDRNRAMERVHQHAQIDTSRILFEALENIERLASQLAAKAEGSQTLMLFHSFEQGVTAIFTQTFPILQKRIMAMRRATYVLTYASEQEAIGRATKRPEPRIGRDAFKHGLQTAINKPTLMGPLDKRIWHALMQLRQRICSAFLSAIMSPEIKPQQILARVKMAFPPIRKYKRAPRVLTREASGKGAGKSWFQSDFVDDYEWDDAVEQYLETTVPENRFDNVTQYVSRDGVAKYNWELEQEVTEDFVRQARDGQVQAARDLGVQDFVWVAILDARTCDDCCAPRNGLTSREIEDLDDDCDATVPPAHFNCRCTVSPVASVDEVEGPDWEGFNEWLES